VGGRRRGARVALSAVVVGRSDEGAIRLVDLT
jgi:hypothetical protein